MTSSSPLPTAKPLTLPKRLNGHRHNGAVHRPMAEAERGAQRVGEEVEMRYLDAGDLGPLREAGVSLAKVEAEQRQLTEEVWDARAKDASAWRRPKSDRLLKLEERECELKVAHGELRVQARKAVLDTLNAVMARSATQYWAASRLLAEAAAELEGVAALRDEMLGKESFDPLGTWARSSVLAPPLAYRPPGWFATPDAWGCEAYWNASSPGHRDGVKRMRERLRCEVEAELSGAGWPF